MGFGYDPEVMCAKCLKMFESVWNVGGQQYCFTCSNIVRATIPVSTYVVTLDDYQRFAGVTANKDLDKKTNIATLALGVAGEAGEVADHIKKHIGHNHDLDVDKVIKELGDVLWYVAVLSNALGVSLSDVARKNIDKLAARYPDGFSVEASKNRKE